MTFEDLDHRLKTAPEHVVRTILRTICHEDYHIKQKTSDYLDKFGAKLSDTTPAIGKRKASETEITLCVNCENPFTEAENSDTACFYHPGTSSSSLHSRRKTLQADFRAGEMYWEDSEGQFDVFEGDPDPDTAENRKEFPEAFVWDCCEERGDGKKGCVRTRHVGLDSKRQRED
jgi:hypothetical protein